MKLTKHQRYLQRVDKCGPKHTKYGRCWVWTGPKLGPYGRAGSLELTHRYAYKTYVGSIPEGLSVLHKCDNPICVRPSHLFVGTQQDNLKDMRDKGRQVRGEQQGSAVLTEEAVKEIRRRYKRYCRKNGTGALSRQFGVGAPQIHNIIKNKAWRHVDVD